MDYNLLLYIGLVLIVFGFGLWLFSEMRIRQIDRQLAENQRFIDAILRVKKWATTNGVMVQVAIKDIQPQEFVVSKALKF